jgi:hypothetical protein
MADPVYSGRDEIADSRRPALATSGRALAIGSSPQLGANTRWNGLRPIIYRIEAGIIAAAVGAWVSSPASGAVRLAIWSAVTAILAVAASWFAEPVVALLMRIIRYGWNHRPPLSRLPISSTAAAAYPGTAHKRRSESERHRSGRDGDLCRDGDVQCRDVDKSGQAAEDQQQGEGDHQDQEGDPDQPLPIA